MKKILQFSVIGLLFLSFLSFQSCKKDDKNAESLVNTTWEYTTTDETQTLQFTSEQNVKFTGEGGGASIELDGTYTYNHPNITLTLIGQQMSGTVSGNEMTISDPDLGQMIFIKK